MKEETCLISDAIIAENFLRGNEYGRARTMELLKAEGVDESSMESIACSS